MNLEHRENRKIAKNQPNPLWHRSKGSCCYVDHFSQKQLKCILWKLRLEPNIYNYFIKIWIQPIAQYYRTFIILPLSWSSTAFGCLENNGKFCIKDRVSSCFWINLFCSNFISTVRTSQRFQLYRFKKVSKHAFQFGRCNSLCYIEFTMDERCPESGDKNATSSAFRHVHLFTLSAVIQSLTAFCLNFAKQIFSRDTSPKMIDNFCLCEIFCICSKQSEEKSPQFWNSFIDVEQKIVMDFSRMECPFYTIKRYLNLSLFYIIFLSSIGSYFRCTSHQNDLIDH